MKLCNQIITVLNARLNKDTDCTEYAGTTISGVSWYGTVKSTVDSNGLKAANQYTIRIPMDADSGGKLYVDPETYATADDVSMLYTLNDGDIMVLGAVTGDDLRPAELQKHYSGYAKILAVTDNRKAPNAPHFKVVGA